MSPIILEILRYTIPSLTVFGTIYFLLNKMANNNLQKELISNQYKLRERNDNFKIQAYERLLLMCERIDPTQLFLRLNIGNITASQLQSAMLVAIQQEFDHNITQQLYVSKELYSIIELAKNQTSNIISQCGDKLYPSDPPSKLLSMITAVKSELKLDPLAQAKTAIKNEFDLLIN